MFARIDSVIELSPGRKRGRRVHQVLAAMFLALLTGAGCASGRQKSFESPDSATQALVAALRTADSDSLDEILGSDGDAIISSGDEVSDQRAIAKFLAAYDENHSLIAESDKQMILEVGKDGWPMPIPLIQKRGTWRFDTRSGKDEILARRIGRNELSAIQVCRAIVDAQREYAQLDPEGKGGRAFARKFVSDSGSRNGLYWESKSGEPPSPLGSLVATASQEGYTADPNKSEEPRPYHGYYYRILTSQGPNAPGGSRNYMDGDRMTGGFAIVAWPAEPGNSGVMTFMVGQGGVVFQRDLGRKTDRVAREMQSFDPDANWEIVSDQ